MVLVNRNKWELEYDSVLEPFHVSLSGVVLRVRKKPMMTAASNNKIWKLYKKHRLDMSLKSFGSFRKRNAHFTIRNWPNANIYLSPKYNEIMKIIIIIIKMR